MTIEIIDSLDDPGRVSREHAWARTATRDRLGTVRVSITRGALLRLTREAARRGVSRVVLMARAIAHAEHLPPMRRARIVSGRVVWLL